jgi:D-xylose transport system substrate-binding protein
MKIRLFVICAILSGLVFNSCTKKKPLVGFMLPHTTIQRYIVEKEEFTSKINALGGEVIFYDAGNDDQKQMKQLDSLLERNIDVLVLDPVNRFTAAEMVRKAHRKGIKVISYDRLISNIDVDAFLSFDPWVVGKQITEAATKAKPEGIYVILGGDKSDLNAIGIDESMQKVLEPYLSSNSIKIDYKVFIERWSYEDSYLEVKRYLNLSGKVPDVILATSDLIARGTIDALKENQLEGKVLVTGQGGELFACKNIMDGNQLMTVYKPVKKLAVLAAELSIKMLNNEKTDDILNTTIYNGFADIPSHMLVPVPVDASNLRATIVADGMIKESDLQ